LFYFFRSKKALYLYVLDYTVKRFVEFMDQSKDELPRDFLALLANLEGKPT